MANMTGKTLGKYRLIERLGRGGMAEVYRAYQPRLERDVAVKVMLGYLAEDEKFVGRFEREAKAVAALHHPHIVQIYDFDIEDDTDWHIKRHYLYACFFRFETDGALISFLKRIVIGEINVLVD